MVRTRLRTYTKDIKNPAVHARHILIINWLLRMEFTFTWPEPKELFSMKIHKIASACNPSTNISQTLKPIYLCMYFCIACHVCRMINRNFSLLSKSTLVLKVTILNTINIWISFQVSTVLFKAIKIITFHVFLISYDFALKSIFVFNLWCWSIL